MSLAVMYDQSSSVFVCMEPNQGQCSHSHPSNASSIEQLSDMLKRGDFASAGTLVDRVEKCRTHWVFSAAFKKSHPVEAVAVTLAVQSDTELYQAMWKMFVDANDRRTHIARGNPSPL